MEDLYQLAADVFTSRTGRKHIFNLTAIDNVSSIIKNGILCYDAASGLEHSSIANVSVQERREQVVIPNGGRLHGYANCYFDFNNPMFYSKKDEAENICVLAVNTSVLNNPKCVITDRNAATDLAKFYSAIDGVEQISFDKVYAQYWTHDDPYEQMNHKAIKCAEVLVPQCIPYEYVDGAYVVSQTAKIALEDTGFDRKIVINPKVFYR